MFADANLDRDRIALGIQQPWPELILKGIKTVEVRSQPTAKRGRIWLYASKRFSQLPAALDACRTFQIDSDRLPTGLLVGTVEVVGCRPCRSNDAAAACVPASLLRDRFAWELADPIRLAEPIQVRFLPYGVWFYPFKRRAGEAGRKRRLT